MNYVNIIPGIKIGLRQTFTITVANRIFFLTHDSRNDAIEWNCFIDYIEEADLKELIERDLKEFIKKDLTNQ